MQAIHMSEQNTNSMYRTLDHLEQYHPQVAREVRAKGKASRVEGHPVVTSYIDALLALRRPEYDKVIIPRDCVRNAREMGFSAARIALPTAAGKLRDGRERNSLLLTEYDTYYVADLNLFNPDRGRLLDYALTDAKWYTLGAAAALVGLTFWVTSPDN